MRVEDLDMMIRRVIDIHGVSIGSIHNKETWNVCYKTEPNNEQKQRVTEIIKNFNYDGKIEPKKEVSLTDIVEALYAKIALNNEAPLNLIIQKRKELTVREI